MNYYLGIDPGVTGGIALLSPEGACLWAVKRPPDHQVEEILQGAIGESNELTCYLEKMAGAPPGKRSYSSMTRLGYERGFYRAMLLVLGIPFEEVAPGTWQKGMRCLTKGDKKVSLAAARERFPASKPTHATADAILIAAWGRQLHLGLSGRK